MASLPIELYKIFLEYLDYRSLLKCMQVSSLFQKLIKDTASLQYIIELAAAGQTNGPEASGTSSADRLEALKKHQSSWGSLNWSRELRIPMESGGLWELYGGVLAQSTAEGTLTFTQLPSDLRSIEEKVWTLGPNLGLVLRDFGMDPSQDLLVLIEIESPNWNTPEVARKHFIHLRSLSDGNPHPLARDAPVLSHVQGDMTAQSYTIQVSGCFIAIQFCSDGSNELGIWNWMTGELQVNIKGNAIRSFSFLSDTHVILAALDDDGFPQLVVLNFQQESSEPHNFEDLQCAVKFSYPEFEDRQSFFLDIDIRADPGPSWRPNAKLQAPFSQDTSHTLFVVSLWMRMEGALGCLVQFLPSNGLTSLIESEVTSYEWEEWGPHRSRFFIPSQPHSGTWVCYVYGSKYVKLEPDASQDGLVVHLYDFNQVAINRNYRDTMDKETGDRWQCKRAGTLVAETIFEDLVETTLPYRSQALSLKDIHNHCLALCSEDHIIIVDPECREYRVLIF
ncbi:hypothetical protein BYT27DRAFT_7189834 [Phlegmacium glaucopus]|nr:hypothetical protein BYT27DRAFT_7189834 [Phlegmacium glaucopus]